MRTIHRLQMSTLIVCLLCAPAIRAGTIVFNFDSDPTGEATTFTNNVGVLSATFSSSGDPGGFEVFPSFFDTLTGQVLLDTPNIPLTLTISFNYTATAISMDFATYSTSGVPFDLSAYDGSTLVGTASATGSLPQGFYNPEGVIDFSGAGFNEVVLSAPTAEAFAIDNVALTTSIPEPGAYLLMLSGFAILALRLLYSKRSPINSASLRRSV